MDSDLRIARRLIELAARIALPRWRGDPSVSMKQDGTPVSDVDLAVEEALIRQLRTWRPDDAVLSEECGSRGRAARRWIIDPIDGTQAFISGTEAWGTHVALQVDGRIVLGLISRPSRRTLCWAVTGTGAWHEDLNAAKRQRLSIPGARSVPGTVFGGFCGVDADPRRALAKHMTWVEDDYSIFEELLRGKVDAVIDDGGQPWDIAPRVALIAEAGGVFRDPHGGSRIDLGGGLYTTRQLEPLLSRLLTGSRFCGPPRTVWREPAATAGP
jgi:histidinol-phosphatase